MWSEGKMVALVLSHYNSNVGQVLPLNVSEQYLIAGILYSPPSILGMKTDPEGGVIFL